MSKKATQSTYLHLSTLLRLLAVLAFVLAPHSLRLPLWESAAIFAVLAWRAWAAVHGVGMPGRVVRAMLTIAAFAGIFMSYGRVTGQHAGVALLALMAALKLTELNQRRDVMVTVFLLYFICVTHFLFSQEIWTIAYLLLTTVIITALLVEANHAGAPLPVRVSLRHGGSLVLQALPLMVLMFVLFPRLPGPLWGLPSDSGAARTGLSDHMSPGDISGLIQSGELAFRVKFDGNIPPPRLRYWRGPVFWDFDGREWTAGGLISSDSATVELLGKPLGYEIVLEPHRSRWLFALDFPDPRSLPDGATVAPDGIVLSAADIKERFLYHLQSHTAYHFQPQLAERARRAATRLPQGRNPKALALGQSWRALGLSDEAIVRTALSRFTAEPFFYTLRPPSLGRDPVDEFLFETRKGFCEHYASSFTVLMRAAGIPARVVTGYQGGEQNAIGGYFVVNQSDAHAWVEVWRAGEGWLRIDPTAAVAPNRIEKSLSDALSFDEALPLGLARGGSKFLQGVKARWDWTNAQWNRWVLAYGPDLQRDFLSRFGLAGWRDLMLALTAALAVVVGGFGLLALLRARPAHPEDAALKAWRRAIKPLARQGLIQRPSEGPQAFARRVIEARPELRTGMETVLAGYLELRYLSPQEAGSGQATRLKSIRLAAADF